MHITEGALSAPVLISGAAAAVAGIGIGLKKMDYEEVPKVAVLASAFFVASLIHVPIGPASAHLVLNGLAGLILGWAAFPAMAVALFLQALLFGFGGLTGLGVNTFLMAFPGLICHYLFGPWISAQSNRTAFLAGFGAGALGIALGCLIMASALFLSNQGFLSVAQLALAAHLPVLIIEGIISGFIILFLRKVKPELLSQKRPKKPFDKRVGQAEDLGRQKRGFSGLGPDRSKTFPGKPSRAVVPILILGLCLILPNSAPAHRIKVFASAEGDMITGYVYFPGGGKAAGAGVELLDPDGKPLSRAKTDDQGAFRFKVETRQAYRVRADTGDGHTGSFMVSGDELDPKLPPAKGGAVPAQPAQKAAVPGERVAAGVTAEEISRIVADRVKPLQAQVTNLRREVEAYTDKTRLHDIIGGIGYILGLAGLFLYFKKKA